jgi:hypothetical protein
MTNRQTSAPVGDSDGEGFDVGMLMLPCFGLILLFMWYLRLNATFNNISAISWLTVLLVEETRVLGENNRPVVSH